MNTDPISLRQCKRCGITGLKPFDNNLCPACTNWQKQNPTKVIK